MYFFKINLEPSLPAEFSEIALLIIHGFILPNIAAINDAK